MEEFFTPVARPLADFYPTWPEINIDRQKNEQPIIGIKTYGTAAYCETVTLRTTVRILWQKQYYMLRCSDSKVYDLGMNVSIHLVEFIRDVYHAQVFFYPPGKLTGTPHDACLDPDQRSEGERLLSLLEKGASYGK